MSRRLTRASLTDADVIAAIRADHLQTNISNRHYVRHHWDNYRRRYETFKSAFRPSLIYPSASVAWKSGVRG